LAALAYSFLLARSYSRPLEALAAQSRRISNLDFQTDAKIEAKLFEFKQLSEAQAQSLAALQSFSRYVPLEIVKELMAKGEVARIGGHTETLTILFHRHCRFHQHLGSHVSGGLDQSPGRVFPGHDRRPAPPRGHGGQDRRRRHSRLLGAPTAMPDQADRALKAVLECRDTLEALNQTWGAQGLPKLPTRFG